MKKTHPASEEAGCVFLTGNEGVSDYTRRNS